MRLGPPHGLRHAVTRPSFPSSSSLQLLYQPPIRTINTKPQHERPHPITEQINLRPQPNPRAQSIGILGAGVTGLTAAWHLSRLIPQAKITIYEKQERLGGWLDSEIVKVDGGEVLFEWGPRSLRPDPAGAGRATILLILQLLLQQEIIGVTKQAPAALNRFIYYGGHLVKMPGPDPNLPPFLNIIRNGWKVLTEPIFKGVMGSIFAEYWVKPRPTNMTDESVGDFIARRFGSVAADNLASAFFHGIYAGDLYKLSARTLLPALWHMETRDPEGAGILMEMTDIAFKGQGLMQHKHGRYVDLLEAAADHDDTATTRFLQDMHHDLSVYTFGQGLQRLGQRLEEAIRENPNIEIRTKAEVEALNFDPKTKKTKVVTSASDSLEHDYIVSTLSAPRLASCTLASAKSRGSTPKESQMQTFNEYKHSVNVGVVNLYYSNPNVIPTSHRGFGYLIPRTVDVQSNPERALGVIFGSETSGTRGPDAVRDVPHPHAESVRETEKLLKIVPEGLTEEQRKVFIQETEDAKAMLEVVKADIAKHGETLTLRTGQDTAPGTKLTVMLGGHWWDTWSESDLPDSTQLIEMAKSVLARHLKITEAPVIAKARMNKDCIPQYHVGYRQRMAAIHQVLMEEFQGRVKVAGPWWQGGVGVNDCVLSAHMTAFNIREEWEDETGLKEYTEKEKWLICDRRTQTFSPDTGK